MLIRIPKKNEMVQILKMSLKDDTSNVKDFSHKISDLVALDDKDNIIAYGMLRTMCEGIITVDYNYPRITRARAYKDLLIAGEYVAKEMGYNELHTFAHDDKIIKMLRERFGFGGIGSACLIKDL